jgi:hypothetical protein
MAVIDDLKTLGEQEVVYLTKTLSGSGLGEVYRGRLREAANGAWVFHAFTGANGLVGIDLGPLADTWASGEQPSGGVSVSVTYGQGAASQIVTVAEVISDDYLE